MLIPKDFCRFFLVLDFMTFLVLLLPFATAQLQPGQYSIMQNELLNVQYPLFSCDVESRHILSKVKDDDKTTLNFLTDEDVLNYINDNTDEALGNILDERTKSYIYLHQGDHVGRFEFEIRPDWSPNGVKRFIELFNDNYFENLPFYRVVPDFLVSFGLSGTPSKNQKWLQTFEDDPFPESLTGKYY